ncbi:MAG: M23 family metallopeptidase, partial [Candidatus Nanopelagicales bacterium]
MPISAIRVPARRLTWRAAVLSTAVAVAIMILGGVWVGLPAAASPLRFSPWLSPLPGTLQVIAAFDPPAQNWLAGHRGVDLAATPGTPVQAAGGGIVTFAATIAGRGVVTVTHSSGRTTYEPVTASVDIGQAVDAGEVIGIVTGGGHCSERCLH